MIKTDMKGVNAAVDAAVKEGKNALFLDIDEAGKVTIVAQHQFDPSDKAAFAQHIWNSAGDKEVHYVVVSFDAKGKDSRYCFILSKNGSTKHKMQFATGYTNFKNGLLNVNDLASLDSEQDITEALPAAYQKILDRMP